MTINDIISKNYGVNVTTNVNPITDLVQTTSTKLLLNNPNRLTWYLINLSTSQIYLNFGTDVSMSKGFMVDSSGGIISFTALNDLVLPSYELFGISDVADRPIYLLEVITIGGN